MSLSGLLQKLKRKLRRSRRTLSLGVWILLIVLAAAAWRSGYLKNTSSNEWPDSVELAWTDPTMESTPDKAVDHSQDHITDTLKRNKIDKDVIVRKQYVCGQENAQLGAKSAEEILRLHLDHPEWKVVLDDTEAVTFIEEIDDLSDDCKETAVFGIDGKDHLTLYYNKRNSDDPPFALPFFQLNMEHLKNSLPQEVVKELQAGIRVRDFADYNSVLSSFSEFAVEETHEVMKPNH